MSNSFFTYAPALGLLLLMGLFAWAVHWLKQRTSGGHSAAGAKLRLVSHIMLGTQQRIAVVEVDGPEGQVQLTLGITAQHINLLHTQKVAALPEEDYASIASDLGFSADRGMQP